MSTLRTALLDALRELERTQFYVVYHEADEEKCITCGGYVDSRGRGAHYCARTRLHADIADAIRRSE